MFPLREVQQMKMIGSSTKVERADGQARILSRQEERERASQVAFDAAQRRQTRTGTLVQRVEAAKRVLKGRSVAETISIIDAVRPFDRDIYLIAEEEDAARKSVLGRYGKIRKEVQEKYLSEAGLTTPEQTAQSGKE
jgi:hypothetical protein